MSLTEVIGDVRRGGEAKAKATLAEARARADATLAAAREKAHAYEALRLKEGERDGAQAKAQVLARAESEARKKVLTTEAALRTELRAAILRHLADLPAKSRAAHIEKLAARAHKELGGGKVWGAKDDATALKAQKHFAYAGDAPISGGIIAESADGKSRLDLSYETLLDEAWRDILRGEAALFT